MQRLIDCALPQGPPWVSSLDALYAMTGRMLAIAPPVPPPIIEPEPPLVLNVPVWVRLLQGGGQILIFYVLAALRAAGPESHTFLDAAIRRLVTASEFFELLSVVWLCIAASSAWACHYALLILALLACLDAFLLLVFKRSNPEEPACFCIAAATSCRFVSAALDVLGQLLLRRFSAARVAIADHLLPALPVFLVWTLIYRRYHSSDHSSSPTDDDQTDSTAPAQPPPPPYLADDDTVTNKSHLTLRRAFAHAFSLPGLRSYRVSLALAACLYAANVLRVWLVDLHSLPPAVQFAIHRGPELVLLASMYVLLGWDHEWGGSDQHHFTEVSSPAQPVSDEKETLWSFNKEWHSSRDGQVLWETDPLVARAKLYEAACSCLPHGATSFDVRVFVSLDFEGHSAHLAFNLPPPSLPLVH